MGDMISPMTKTTPPQVQVENAVCSVTSHEDYALKLANGTVLDKSNFLQFVSVDKVPVIDVKGTKTPEIWYDFGGGNKAYYYHSEQAGGLVEAPFMTNSFNMGDKAVTFSISRGDVPYVGHKMGVIGSDSKNLVVDGTPTQRVYVCTVDETIGVKDENGNYIHNAVNDIYYQTDTAVKKAKVNSFSYYDNPPTTDVAEPPVIDINMPVKMAINIFPNPVIGESVSFSFEPYDKPASVVILNSRGDQVYSAELPAGQRELVLGGRDFRDFSAGTYYVTIHGQNKEIRQGMFTVAR